MNLVSRRRFIAQSSLAAGSILTFSKSLFAQGSGDQDRIAAELLKPATDHIGRPGLRQMATFFFEAAWRLVRDGQRFDVTNDSRIYGLVKDFVDVGLTTVPQQRPDVVVLQFGLGETFPRIFPRRRCTQK